MYILKLRSFIPLALCFISSVNAMECRIWQPEDNINNDLIIGKIILSARDIFDLSDPDENHGIHRLANRLHIQTREEVVRRQLLFAPGDFFDPRLLDETERLLRANQYIKDAVIKPKKICGHAVEIEVQTTDNWTLTPNISFGRSGGENTSGAEIQEHNLLGYGKDLTLSYKDRVDRNSALFFYRDPQFLGTRKIFSISAQDNTDGEAYSLNYALPFYQLNSLRSWGISTSTNRQETSIYNNGVVSYKLGEKSDRVEIFTGWSKGMVPDSDGKSEVIRFRTGWQYESKDFFRVDGPSPAPMPRVLSYPWVELEYFQEDFIQRKNLRSMGVVEDISLGHHFIVRAGLLHESLGSSDNYLNLSASYSNGFVPASNQLGLLTLSGETFSGNGSLEGGRFKARGEWYYFQNKWNNLYVSGVYQIATNLQAEEQILLGGDTGLRGYPLRFQSGDEAFLLSVEQRHFFDWYPYKLFQAGVAVFVDTGSAWGDNNKIKVLSDVGFGLRLVSTRSTGASIIHIDFAFPLDTQGNVDSFQVLVGTKKSL